MSGWDVMKYFPESVQNLPWSKYAELGLPIAGLGLAALTNATSPWTILAPTAVSALMGHFGSSKASAETAGNAAGLVGAMANRNNPLNPMTHMLGAQLNASNIARKWEEAPLALPGKDEYLTPTPEGRDRYFKEAQLTGLDGGLCTNKLITRELFDKIGTREVGNRVLVTSPALGVGRFYLYNENGVPVIRQEQFAVNDRNQQTPIGVGELQGEQLKKQLRLLELAKYKKYTDRYRYIDA